jgi:transcriptional regulator with XRE-family HTH domain
MDLVTIRAKTRKTQFDIRLATGIHQSKLSNIERGYVVPTAAEKRAIAKALRVPVAKIDWPECREEVN